MKSLSLVALGIAIAAFSSHINAQSNDIIFSELKPSDKPIIIDIARNRLPKGDGGSTCPDTQLCQYILDGWIMGMSQHGGVERNWAKHSYVCLLHAKFQAKDPHCNELPQRVLAAELPFHLKWQFLDSGYQRWAWLEPSNVPWVADALRDKSYAEATVALPLLKTNSEESMLFNRRLLALYFPELMPLLNGMGADDLFVASLVDARPFRKLEEWMGTMDTNMNTTPKALSLPTMQEMSP